MIPSPNYPRGKAMPDTNTLSREELWRLRAMIQKVGWPNFWNEIGSLMAEQADKVERDSEQDRALYILSCFMHGKEANNLIQHCGFFDYRKMLTMVPEEYRQIITDSSPAEHQ